MVSERRHRSRKRRLFKAYHYDYLRLARLEAVRDLGDHRRFWWAAHPESIGQDPPFEPTRQDDERLYEGHWQLDPERGRVWVVEREVPKPLPLSPDGISAEDEAALDAIVEKFS